MEWKDEELKRLEEQRIKEYDNYYRTEKQVKEGNLSPGYLEIQKQSIIENINTTEKLQESNSSPLSSITSFTDNLVKSTQDTIGGLANQVSTTVNSVTNSVTGIVTNVKDQITNSVTSVVNQADKIKQGVMTGVNMAQQSISDVLSSATNSVKNIFSSDDEKAAAQAVLNSPKADKGQKEANTKVETLSGDDQSAIAKPVSFVTQTVQQVTTSTKSEPKETSKEELPKTGELAKTAEELKTSSVSETITKVSNDLKTNVEKSTSSLQNFLNETTAMVDSTVKTVKGSVDSAISSVKSTITGYLNSPNGVVSSVVSTVKSGISSTISFAKPLLEAPGQILDAGKSIGSSIASAFPGSIGKNLNALNESFFNKTANKLMQSKLGTAANIVNKLDGICSSDDVLSSLFKLGGSYGSNTDSLGNLIAGSGSLNASSSDKLYELAKSLCSGITNNSGIDFSYNKDLYDILLGLCADFGMSDLLMQLANCGSAQKYLDQRSMDLIRTKLPSIAQSGDASTMKSAVDAIGASAVSKVENNMTVLIGNMSEEKVNSQSKDLDDLLNAFHTSPAALVDGKSEKVDSVSAKNVALMSSSNTTVVDSTIGSDNRKLVQSSYLMYGYN